MSAYLQGMPQAFEFILETNSNTTANAEIIRYIQYVGNISKCDFTNFNFVFIFDRPFMEPKSCTIVQATVVQNANPSLYNVQPNGAAQQSMYNPNPYSPSAYSPTAYGRPAYKPVH